jgi:PAS domain S-box-containing protein
MENRSKPNARRSADRELAESEARYRALVESSPLPLFVVRNGKVLLANPACVKLFKASSAEDLLGGSASELFHRDSQSLVRERMLVGSETVPSVDVRIVRLDGAVVDVEAAASPFLDQGVKAIQVLLRDITERKQAAQALAESEARYRLLAESAALGIVVCRNEKHNDEILVINPACTKMFGVSSPDDLIGKSLLSLFAPDSWHVVRQLLGGASGEVVPFVDAQIVTADHGVVDVSITATPMLHDGLAAFNIVLRDVSEARLLAAQAAKLAAIVLSSPDAIITKTLDDVIVSWNPAAEALYGYTADEMIGRSVEVLMPPGHEGEPLDLIARIVAGEPLVRYETQRLRKDGSLMDVVLTLFPIRDEKGGISAISVMAHETTEQKRLEQERLHAESIFRDTFERTTIGIAHMGTDGTWLRVNQTLCDLLGYSREELLAITYLGIVHPDDIEEAHHAIRRLGSGEDSLYSADKRCLRKDGSFVWTHMDISLIRKADGTPDFSVTIIDEITERRRAEELAAQQSERIERTLNSVVDIASSIVEMRDPYTAGHQRRVSELAVKIAERLGMSGHEVDDILVAALLHDMGKTAVPAELLTKPGALSPVEFALIKAHPEAGYRLAVSANMPELISEMIYQHQERCDGSGYPRGLKGDQMLIGAKVIAIADVVEAMSSHRPYRSALGTVAALAEIERGAGTLYDARASEACMSVFNEDGFEFSEP